MKRIILTLVFFNSILSFSQQKELSKMLNYLEKGEIDNYNKNLNKFIEKGNDTLSADFLYLKALEKEKASDYIQSKLYLNKIDCNLSNKIGAFPSLSTAEGCKKETSVFTEKLFDAFFRANLNPDKVTDDAQLEKVHLMLITFKEYDEATINYSDIKSPTSRYKIQKKNKASYEFEKIKDSKQKIDFENFIANNPSEEDSYKEIINKQYELIDFEKAMASEDIKLLEAFVNKYTNSKRIKDINFKIEDIIWENTLKANSKNAYDEFIEKYPKSVNVSVAKSNKVKIEFDVVKESGKHHEIINFMLENKDNEEYYNLAKNELSLIEKENFMFYFVVDNSSDTHQINHTEICAYILLNSDIYTEVFINYLNNKNELKDQLASIINIENVYSNAVANNGKIDLNLGIVNIKEFENLVSRFSNNQSFTFGNNEISLKNKRYEINKVFEKFSIYNLTGNLHNLFLESYDYKILKQDIKPIDNKFYTVDIEVDVSANNWYDKASKVIINYLKLIALSEKDEHVGDVYRLKIYNDDNGVFNTLTGINVKGNSDKMQIESLYYNFIFRNKESIDLINLLFRNQTFYVKNFQLYNGYKSLVRGGITNELKYANKNWGTDNLWDKSILWNNSGTNWESSARKANIPNEHNLYPRYDNEKLILPNKIDAITKVYVLDTISDIELNQMKAYEAIRLSGQNFKFKNGGIHIGNEDLDVVVSLIDLDNNYYDSKMPCLQNHCDWELPSTGFLEFLYDSLLKYQFLFANGRGIEYEYLESNEKDFIEFDENSCCLRTFMYFNYNKNLIPPYFTNTI